MVRVHTPKRVSNKIVLLVLSLELVSITLWGSITYTGSKAELLSSISSQLSERALRTTSEIGNFFLPITVETETLATTVTSKLLLSRQKDLLFHRLLNARPEVDEVSFVQADGIETLRLSRMRAFGPSDLRDLSQVELIQKGLSGQRSTGPIYFSEYYEPQVSIATPVRGKNGGYGAGVILTQVNLKWLWDIVQSQAIGESGYVYVVNKDLELVAHPDPSLVLSDLSVSDSGVPAAMFRNGGRNELKRYHNFAGVRVAGVSRFDPSHQWWVVVEQPVAEGLAPLDRLINRFVIAFILAATLTALIVIFFSQLMMRPLSSLRHGIALLAEGNRNVRIQVPKNTELATLADGFNQMARNLDEQIQHLMDSQHELRQSQQARKESEERVRLLLESTAEGIFGIDLDGHCTLCNPAGLKLLGYESQDQLQGRPVAEILNPTTADGEPLPRRQCPFTNATRLTEGLHVDDLLLQRADGTRFHAECWIHPIHRERDTVGAVLTTLDITERHQYTEQLQYQACHDALTDLPNRQLLREELEKRLGTEATRSPDLTLFLIDLDRFKEVNDSLGHKAGDALLRQLGPRLLKILNSEDILARLGGDEFALITQTPNTDAAVARAHELRRIIREPFDLDHMRVQIDASIGIALCPEHGETAGTLLRLADVAMYQAKAKRIGVAVYDREEDQHSPRRLTLMSQLGDAIERDELVLYYQPKISLSDNRLMGFEALARWQHPEFGLLGPDQFIPLAELGEPITPLTLWVIARALRDQIRFRRNTTSTISVAVNISARNLQDNEFAPQLQRLLESQNLDGGNLQLEITESALMTDPVRAMQTIRELDYLGTTLAIDDFGTGYSSLAYLKQLPVAELKIDKSFVMDMESDDNDAVIVRSTIDLAHNLGMHVTAEGVENESVMQLLSGQGCDLAQGFHICRPIPADEVERWVKQREGAAGTDRTPVNARR